MNKKREAGLSISKSINAKMEWVAEAYMETKYTELNCEYFSETLLNYATFLLGNKLSNQVSHRPFHDSNDIHVNTQNWEYFELEKLFTITGSKTTPLLELEEYGTGVFPYVTTQATNNGVGGFYDFSTEKGNALTVDSAVLGYCSYQKLDFSASDHVEKLIPQFKMNEYIAMFLVTIMNLERYRYNYGRKCSQTRMKEISIKLPSKNNEPDFKYMEGYIKTLPYSSSIKMKEIE